MYLRYKVYRSQHDSSINTLPYSCSDRRTHKFKMFLCQSLDSAKCLNNLNSSNRSLSYTSCFRTFALSQLRIFRYNGSAVDHNEAYWGYDGYEKDTCEPRIQN